MSTSRDDRYGSAGRYRRTPDINAHGGPFVGAQGGRTVLPPLIAAFPTPLHSLSSYAGSQHNQYAPRGSPGRNDAFSPSYGQSSWPANNHLMTGQQSYGYTANDSDSRYTTQPSQPYPSRQSPAPSADVHSSRRLPPINIPHTQQPTRDERWQNLPPGAYNVTSSHSIPTAGNIRSPMAAYPNSYDQYPYGHAGSYPPSHNPGPDARHPPSLVSFGHDTHHTLHGMSQDWGLLSSSHEAHGISPYARPAPVIPAGSHSPQPNTPTESVIKKKRKRADTAQLKILNETYSRTAFPTTEERQELAKILDMSARSVQIWFQNKRQSMRQSRNSTNLAPIVHHPYSSSGPTNVDTHSSGVHGSGRGEVSVTSPSYMRSPIEPSRGVGHTTHPTDTRRGAHSPDNSQRRAAGKY